MGYKSLEQGWQTYKKENEDFAKQRKAKENALAKSNEAAKAEERKELINAKSDAPVSAAKEIKEEVKQDAENKKEQPDTALNKTTDVFSS